MKIRFSEVELDGLGDDIWEELVPRAEAALNVGVEIIVNQIQLNLSRPGTPRTSSAPGTPPEKDDGDLQKSVVAGKIRRRKHSVSKSYEVGFPSAPLHEYGGVVVQNGVKRVFPPRPFVRPAEASTEIAVTAALESL